MSRQTATERKSVYELVTDRIIEQVEKGVAPWRKPWRSGVSVTFNGKPVNGPINAKTGKAYRGINVILLGMSEFSDPRWLTYRQAQDLGGSVKKGEKGSIVVFWKWVEVKASEAVEEDEDNKPQPTSQGRKRVPILRYYIVFNVEQCENLKNLKALEEVEEETTQPENEDLTGMQEAEAILAGIRNKVVRVSHGGDRACYRPSTDEIFMPSVEAFDYLQSYYATRFHEEVHATGAQKRLNRPGIAQMDGFGSDQYAKEELVAEVGAAMLCTLCGIECIDQSAAYVRGWASRLKKDPKLIVVAAGQAQKAVDYILGVDPTADEEEEG